MRTAGVLDEVPPTPPLAISVTESGGARVAPPRTWATSGRVRRNRTAAVVLVAAVAALLAYVLTDGGPSASVGATSHPHRAVAGNPRLDESWDGDGQPVTLVFGGDVNFPRGSVLGSRLAAHPATALGPGAHQLLARSDLAMVNLETALTFGGCPVPQPKQYVFSAPPSAITALRGAGATLVTEANNHGEDCGAPGLTQALTIRARAHYRVIGIGGNARQAFTSYQSVLHGERIGIIAATQVIDSDLAATWTATDTQPGLASAYQVQALVDAVRSARRVDDTVVVFLHWGIQLDACPDPQQEPLARLLVRAGADIVIGSHAHVLLGAGYLGSAFVDYGLGNFAFYNDPPPTNVSGALAITVTGRHIDTYAWRPAIIEGELPVPVTGAAAHEVQARLVGARGCTDLTAHPTAALATPASEGAGVPLGQLRELG
ncbi:MAG TPA: CapA family protein [Acidimicrobiales bacterium]|nr:CapA family protein [Acidimicrobiales bacterium]